MAGAYRTPRGGGGETPEGARQGDRGSELPPIAHPAKWIAGATAEVGFMLGANHGGGYHYSLCPKSSPLTEACLDRMSLGFANDHTTIRYLNKRLPEVDIPSRDVAVGTHPPGSCYRTALAPKTLALWQRLPIR